MFPYAGSAALNDNGLKYDVLYILKSTPRKCHRHVGKFLQRINAVRELDDFDPAIIVADKHRRPSI